MRHSVLDASLGKNIVGAFSVERYFATQRIGRLEAAEMLGWKTVILWGTRFSMLLWAKTLSAHFQSNAISRLTTNWPPRSSRVAWLKGCDSVGHSVPWCFFGQFKHFRHIWVAWKLTGFHTHDPRPLVKLVWNPKHRQGATLNEVRHENFNISECVIYRRGMLRRLQSKWDALAPKRPRRSYSSCVLASL